MFEFFERLGDLFSNGDGSHYDTSGHESVIDGFDGSTLNPKSVIRISLCRTAKRNPLIFPI